MYNISNICHQTSRWQYDRDDKELDPYFKLKRIWMDHFMYGGTESTFYIGQDKMWI